MDILPSTHGDFAKRDYWDKFFDGDGGKSRVADNFEWYGSWADVASPVKAHVTGASDVLVVGCGNSSLSEDMRNDSFASRRIVSVDFSEVVIDKMKKRAAQKGYDSAELSYLVADVTKMNESWSESFDCVFDKGTLDAVMGEVSDANAGALGAPMLSEIDRVLRPGGWYVCVTLAQSHILRQLLSAFCGSDTQSAWGVHVRRVVPKEESPLCTFLFMAQKQAPNAPSVHSYICSGGAEESKEQTPELLKMYIEESQIVHYSHRKIRKLNAKGGVVGTFDIGAKASSDADASSVKYKIWVVDSGMAIPVESLAIHMGVFIVPQGREHEWKFCAQESQLEIARTNRIGRLVFVAMGRGHAFESSESVQAEVAPFVLDLIPKDEKGRAWNRLRAGQDKVPFLGVGGGDIGYRNIVHRGTSALSGEYYVEDVRLGSSKHLLRRLVFMSNESAVQSEARLDDGTKDRERAKAEAADAEWGAALAEAHGKTKVSRGKKKGKKGKKGKKKKKQTQKTSKSEAAVALAAEAEPPNAARISPDVRIDVTFLAMEFHCVIASGLAGLGALSKPNSTCVLVGLGGGGLASVLLQQDAYPALDRLDVIELDQAVVDVARRFFDFPESPKCVVTIGEGVKELTRIANAESPERRDVCILDVDAKDLTSPLSFPPAAFVEETFLARICKDVLKPGGTLAVNVACRSEAMLEDIERRFAKAGFARVLAVSLAEEVGFLNTVIFAQSPSNNNAGSAHPSVKAVRKAAKDAFAGGRLTGELSLVDCLASMRIVQSPK